jgi:hypothetical protein
VSALPFIHIIVLYLVMRSLASTPMHGGLQLAQHGLPAPCELVAEHARLPLPADDWKFHI